ncbi:unnamed protein product [Caenorhabditis auriculariae]|uniref:G-protein coupled receptors family 1 profile domain-containing protein n=1 Tax=Caenorhabditis auriculariae TaxID=2777116 RepID=A0A8S1HI28_9PELO|nr:unnamed protein product [Caenorhabditis auriculariae]
MGCKKSRLNTNLDGTVFSRVSVLHDLCQSFSFVHTFFSITYQRSPALERLENPPFMACLKNEQLLFVKDHLTSFLWRYVFPLQFLLGILGNSLNLWVLASDEMPNLAAVSFCDLAFLLVMLPHSLSSYDVIAYSYDFRYFYLNSKQHMSAIANWMSAAAIWLILAVSIERLLIVRSPLRAKLYWQRGRMVVVLSSIFVATGLLTVYHHFEWDCVIEEFCNGTQMIDFCWYSGMRHQKTYRKMDYIDPSEVKKIYMQFSTFLNAILVVFAPIVLVIVLNVMMIRQLHVSWKCPQLEAVRGTLSKHQMRQRQRVTITVIAIGICFSLSQGPSAFMVLYELFAGYDNVGSTFYAIFSITNSLVVTGKTINFILFCLSSEHFRRKCFVLLYRKFPKLSQSSIGKRLIDHQRSNSTDVRASVRTLRSRRDSAARESCLLTSQPMTTSLSAPSTPVECSPITPHQKLELEHLRRHHSSPPQHTCQSLSLNNGCDFRNERRPMSPYRGRPEPTRDTKGHKLQTLDACEDVDRLVLAGGVGNSSGCVMEVFVVVSGSIAVVSACFRGVSAAIALPPWICRNDMHSLDVETRLALKFREHGEYMIDVFCVTIDFDCDLEM